MGTVNLAFPSPDLTEVRVVAQACMPFARPSPCPVAEAATTPSATPDALAVPAAVAERSRPAQRDASVALAAAMERSRATQRDNVVPKAFSVMSLSASSPSLSLEEHVLPSLVVAGGRLKAMTMPSGTASVAEATAAPPALAPKLSPATSLPAVTPKSSFAQGVQGSGVWDEKRKQPVKQAPVLFERHQSSPSLPLCVTGSSPPQS